jgi:hypothetical protein
MRRIADHAQGAYNDGVSYARILHDSQAKVRTTTTAAASAGVRGEPVPTRQYMKVGWVAYVRHSRAVG